MKHLLENIKRKKNSSNSIRQLRVYLELIRKKARVGKLPLRLPHYMLSLLLFEVAEIFYILEAKLTAIHPPSIFDFYYTNRHCVYKNRLVFGKHERKVPKDV